MSSCWREKKADQESVSFQVDNSCQYLPLVRDRSRIGPIEADVVWGMERPVPSTRSERVEILAIRVARVGALTRDSRVIEKKTGHGRLVLFLSAVTGFNCFRFVLFYCFLGLIATCLELRRLE